MWKQTDNGAGELAACGGPCREEFVPATCPAQKGVLSLVVVTLLGVTLPLADRTDNAPRPVGRDDSCVPNGIKQSVQTQEGGGSPMPWASHRIYRIFQELTLFSCFTALLVLLCVGWIIAYRESDPGQRRHPWGTQDRRGGVSSRQNYTVKKPATVHAKVVRLGSQPIRPVSSIPPISVVPSPTFTVERRNGREIKGWATRYEARSRGRSSPITLAS